MTRSLLPGICLGGAVFLAGCVNSSPPRPWLEGEKDWPSISRYEVERAGRKVPIELAYQISCADAQSFWIYLYVHDFSRRDSDVELRFSPGTAYIEKENGERFVGHAQRYEKTAKPVPPGDGMDADRCKNPAPPLRSGAAAKQFTLNHPAYLRFDTAAPDANSRWKLDMGRVVVGNTEIQLPVKHIVLRKTQWSMQKIQ